MKVLYDGLDPFYYESIVVSGVPIGLTHNTAREVLITIEGDIRYRLDGINPTSSEGHKAGNGLVLRGRGQIDNFKAIRITDDATIRVTYFR